MGILKFDRRLLLIFSVFILGCECCCDCRNPTEVTMTLDISFAEEEGRICPLPIPNSTADPCVSIGNNAIELRSTEWDNRKYTLFAEYVTCCDDFAFSSVIRACSLDGTCEAFANNNGNSTWTFTFALNTAIPDCMPSIPVPHSAEGTIALRVYYKEPCILDCHSPALCNDPTDRYTVTYEFKGNIVIPEGDFTLPVELRKTKSNCSECH